MSKAIIAGSRDFLDVEYMNDKLSKFSFITEVVCGKAAGADKLGEDWANGNGIPVKAFPAEWTKYGKSAGFIRNTEMAEYADILIAFWDGESPGTTHMIKQAKKYKLGMTIFEYNKPNEDW